MYWYEPITKVDKKTIDKACAVIKTQLGSYDAVAREVSHVVGPAFAVTGQTIRNWFIARRIPVRYAAILVDLIDETDDTISLYELVPWLEYHI
jgi:hypothetical protein